MSKHSKIIFGIGAILILIASFLLGALMGGGHMRSKYERQALSRGYAHIDETTNKFTWKDELAVYYKLRSTYGEGPEKK